MFGANVRMYFRSRVREVVSRLMLVIACLQSECLGARILRSSCTTDWGREGSCILLSRCPPLLDVVSAIISSNNNNTRINQVDFLKKSQCGGTPILPIVCCPKEHRNIHLAADENCGETVVGRIANGKEARPFEFPWMVLIAYRIENSIGYLCGGSLINPRYVLTAAHCLRTRIMGVRLGEHDKQRSVDCLGNTKNCPRVEDIGIEDSIIHEGYSERVNDIGLLRLERPAVLKLNVIPICLPLTPTLRLESLVGKSPWIAGWGTTESSDVSDVLLKAELTVIDNTECQNRFSSSLVRVNHISASIKDKFCAFGPSGEDSCTGDSGGPLMLPQHRQGKAEKYIIYGIVSYGSQQCSVGLPTVFTAVESYVEWILDNMRP